MLFSADETLDIGSDSGTPVTDDLSVDELEFNGRVRWVELDLSDDADDADHLITPDERLKIRNGPPVAVTRDSRNEWTAEGEVGQHMEELQD